MQKWVVLSAICLLPGCRNLQIPGINSNGPKITVVNPTPGQRVPLSTFMQLLVEDPSGVNKVTVSCPGSNGPILVYTWTTTPFQAVVDLSPCRLPSDGGASITPLILLLNATNGLGQSSSQNLNVQLDSTLAVLTLILPERVRPMSSVQVPIKSNLDLGSPPQVHVGGQLADVVSQPDDPNKSFMATINTGGLGIDNYLGPPDADIPIEVLDDVERPLPVEIDGLSVNGNTTHVNAQIFLSRVLWDRTLPGVLSALNAHSGGLSVRTTATKNGVEIPLEAGPTVGWLPAFMNGSDGTLKMFDVSILDAGKSFNVPKAFDAKGRLWLIPFTTGRPAVISTPAVLLDAETFQPLRSGAKLETNFRPLTQVGDTVCEELFTTFGGCFSEGVAFDLTCIGPTAAQDVSLSLNTIEANGDIAVGAGSGTNYLGINVPSCSDGGTDEYLSVLLPSVPQLTPSPTLFSRLLADQVGRFVLYPSGSNPILVAGNATVGTYFPSPNAAGFPFLNGPTDVVAVRPDDLLLVHLDEPPYTRFSAYPPDAGSAVLSSRIPGNYTYHSEQAAPELPFNAPTGPNGELAVLLTESVNGVAVAMFDSSLRPRWVYHYPRLATSAATVRSVDALQLVASPDFQTFYLVDPDNARVIALAR